MQRVFGNGARPMTWLTVYLFLLGAVTAYGFWVDHQQDVDRCEARNEATAAAAPLGVEALIDEAGQDADPDLIKRIRKNIAGRIDDVSVEC